MYSGYQFTGVTYVQSYLILARCISLQLYNCSECDGKDFECKIQDNVVIVVTPSGMKTFIDEEVNWDEENSHIC